MNYLTSWFPYTTRTIISLFWDGDYRGYTSRGATGYLTHNPMGSSTK